MDCYVEKWIKEGVAESAEAAEAGLTDESLKLFNSKDEAFKRRLHYIITLGGDGTILYAAKQFTGTYIPPIVSFALVRKSLLIVCVRDL